jgi:UMF1 family MFS transporter
MNNAEIELDILQNSPEHENKVASYFSFLDFVEKMGIVIGTTTFGLIANVTGMRMSALSLGVYFLIGLIVLLTVKYDFKKGEVA